MLWTPIDSDAIVYTVYLSNPLDVDWLREVLEVRMNASSERMQTLVSWLCPSETSWVQRF